jgi:hypothetical protein
MSFTINGKVLLRFHTKAGNSPYNKEAGKTWVQASRIVDSYKYSDDADLVILRPIIDKLIFEYNFKDCGKYKKDVEKLVLSNAKSLLKKNVFEVATSKNIAWKRLKYLQGYSNNYVLIHKPSGAKVIIQLGAKKKGKAYMRCDLNPSRLGLGGMEFFRGFLAKLLYNKHKNITFATISTIPKTIKRIDVAVDMLGVDSSDLEGKYIYKDKELKTQVFKSSTGRVQTHYFKSHENDKNEAYWYNKKQWFKDNAKDPIDGGVKSPYGNALYTRFEYRINETDKPIANLKSLLNHLTKLQFRAIDYAKVEDKGYTHALFLRYALHRTLAKALELIPDKHKAEYTATHKEAIIDIWKPEKIWKDGWLEELFILGLIPHDVLKNKWKPKKKTKKKTSG